MAYWLIPFKSFNGDNYTIRIDGAAGVNPITLKGAAQPIVTQEDDDRDMFKPVRLQSGYIRIVDYGGSFNWRNLVPMEAKDRRVELLKMQGGQNRLVWQGYIRPETFSGAFRQYPQEREFPIYCPLSAMEAYDVNSADRTPKNFAWLILYLFQQYSGAEVTEFVFSRPQDVVTWLRHQFQWQNLFDDDDKPKYNALELLEEICTFWGWQCHIQGTTVYFLQGDDSTAGELGVLDMQDMTEVAGGADMTLTPVSWQTLDISEHPIIAVQNTLEYIRGVKNVEIKANINKKDDIVQIPFDSWPDDYRTETVRQTGTNPNWLFLLYEQMAMPGNQFQKDEKDLWLSFANNTNYWSALEVCELYEGDLADKHNYNLHGRVIFHRTTSSPNATNYSLRMVSKRWFNLSEGALVVNARREKLSWADTPSVAWLHLAVKFGNKFYHPTSATTGYWDTTFAAISAQINESQIPDSRQLDGPYMNYNGFGMPIDAPMGGVVEVLFYGASSDVGGVNPIDLAMTGFEVTFVRKKVNALPNTDSDNTYEVKGNAAFQNDVNISTIFASDNNNENGSGIILTPSGYYASVVEYSSQGGAEPKHPERHLVERISDYGSQVRSVLSFSVLNDEITPMTHDTKVTSETQTTYIPVAISHEWADDITNYTMMEV